MAKVDEKKKDANELVMKMSITQGGKMYLVNTIPPAALAAEFKKKGYLAPRHEVEKSLVPAHSGLEAKVKHFEQENAELRSDKRLMQKTISDQKSQIEVLEKALAKKK